MKQKLVPIRVSYNCPFCGVLLNGFDVEKPTRVRCSNILSEEDVLTDNIAYNEAHRPLLERARKHLGVDKWPYSGRCGKSYIRMPLKKKLDK